VGDDTPDAERRYRARFYFDPNSIEMREKKHALFQGYNEAAVPVVEVEFNGWYELRAALADDLGRWSTTDWFPITDSPHVIEIDWQSATSADINNGSLTFWIDNLEVASLTGINNDTQQIDFVRLGALDVAHGIRGSYYLDAFESHRQTYIGLIFSETTPGAANRLPFVPTPIPPVNNTYFINTRTAHVRSCPDTQCSIIADLKSGTEIEVLEIVEGALVRGSTQWYQIQIDGQDGFVHSTLASPIA
jgi:hypothetical protein